jgi:outer membrane protein OmpA-like peptidoglycan-associated protein
LWGLIPVAMLSWIAVHVEADRIEHDLEQRAAVALLLAGHDWASVAFSGRDGILVGMPPHADDPAEALALVRSLWGVRTIEARTRVADRAAQPADAPLSQPIRSVDRAALPPLATTVAVLPAEEPKVPDSRPTAVAAPQPVALAEPQPDAVPVLEDRAIKEADAAAHAPRAQDASPRHIETAAITADAAGVADECQAAVGTLNTVEPVRFERGRSKLDRQSRAALDRLAATAGGCPQVALKVIGHTDARGKAKRNLVLSQRRARAVVSYLIDKGIDAKRLEAVGYGEERPVAPNDTARNRAKNRRIELEITGTGPEPLVSPPTRQGADNGLPDR